MELSAVKHGIEAGRMCPLHRSLQESTRSIRHEEITASSLSYLLARHDGPVSKSDRTIVRVYDPGFISWQ